MKKLESSFTNMVAVLTIISMVVGVLLGFVNKMTVEPIRMANAKNLSNAISQVVPGFDNDPATAPDTLTVDGATYVVYKAFKGDRFIGAAVESATMGFGGELKIIVGFDPEGNILDYSILQIAETPGLGSKAATWFKKGERGDITGKHPGNEPLKVDKDGGQIDAITASTITSRAFLAAVNNAYAAYTQAGTTSAGVGKADEAVDAASGATMQVDSIQSNQKQEEKNHE